MGSIELVQQQGRRGLQDIADIGCLQEGCLQGSHRLGACRKACLRRACRMMYPTDPSADAKLCPLHLLLLQVKLHCHQLSGLYLN
jgi:hypothetical protein